MGFLAIRSDAEESEKFEHEDVDDEEVDDEEVDNEDAAMVQENQREGANVSTMFIDQSANQSTISRASSVQALSERAGKGILASKSNASGYVAKNLAQTSRERGAIPKACEQYTVRASSSSSSSPINGGMD